MAKESYWQFDTDPDLNTDIGGLDIDENCDAANINNGIRRLMAEARKYANDTSGKLVSGGTGTAYTLTTESTLTAYANGIRLTWIVNTDCTGAATLNVNAIGAKALRKDDDQALVSGDLQAGMVAEAMYNASANAAAGAWLLTRTYANLASYITASSTNTLTNKTINASNNTISNITVAMMAASAVVTEAEGTASSDNDTSFPTTAAVINEFIAKNLLTTRGDIIYRNATAPARLAKGNSGDVLTMGADDPAWAAPAAAGGTVQASEMTADFTTTSGTEANVTGLSFAVGANETWGFIVVGLYNSPTSDVLTLDVNGPAAPTGVSFQATSLDIAGSAIVSNTAAAFGGDMALATTATGTGMFTLVGRVQNGANAGTVQVRGKRTSGADTNRIGRTVILYWQE